jgi:hypothetical protein
LIVGSAKGGRPEWKSKKYGGRSEIAGCNDGVNGFESQDDQFINDIERDRLPVKMSTCGCVYLPAPIDAYFLTTSLFSCNPFGKEGSDIDQVVTFFFNSF